MGFTFRQFYEDALTGWYRSSLQLIGAFSGIRVYHENDFSLIVDGVKETVSAYSIPPGFRLVVNEFFYVLAKVRIPPQLRVDVLEKFSFYSYLPTAKILPEGFLKLVCFKYFEVTRQISPLFFQRRGGLPSVFPTTLCLI